MADEGTTPLQDALAKAISASGKARDYFDTLYQQRTGKTGKPIYDVMRGVSKRPQPETLRLIAEVMGLEPERLVRMAYGQTLPAPATEPSVAPTAEASDVAMVGIRHADAEFGLGAVFTDQPTEVQVLQFPKPWVDQITYTPPELLSWVPARGSSMIPTINEGDMILIDHSDRRVRDQDELWAYTVGETRGIKRLRVKGDRFQILSDNPAVPPDEEPIDFVNIIGRVIFVGRRT